MHFSAMLKPEMTAAKAVADKGKSTTPAAQNLKGCTNSKKYEGSITEAVDSLLST